MKKIAFSVFVLLAVSAGAADASVKYRGIFINDEDWSLRPWAVKHFGKEEQIGKRVYEMIFSLMKEDGLNLLWPAMHEGGYEFSSRPENLELAAAYGIAVGTSHCEPMLRNNCYLSKADKAKWSWVSNRDFLLDYWREGVRRGQGKDVLWTVGMRGIHDGRMPDGKTVREKIKILEEVFAAQCDMLPEGAPKLFVPYKEVLPIFNAGLKVPEGTVIMWTNDNFGYVRRLGGPQCDGYGGGIYWHLSYHGSPHGYIHLCTTPPAFMWYELVAKCWNNGVRDVWMVNAGDVFQAEILLDAFGRFAANPEGWKSKVDPQGDVLCEWVERTFDKKTSDARLKAEEEPDVGCRLSDVLKKRIVVHLAEYYSLGFNRKPEHMCVQWTTNLPSGVKSDLLRRYHAFLSEDLAIEDLLGKSAGANAQAVQDRYFQSVGFQARFLAHAGIIHLEGKGHDYARRVIDPLYTRWDGLCGGKWSGFWCDTIDENGGKRQPTAHNRWSSQMQWPWNEPADSGAKDRGVPRFAYPATAYRADEEEPAWIEPVSATPANGGAWTRIAGLGTSGRAFALLPVKPGVGEGATMEYNLAKCCQCENVANANANVANVAMDGSGRNLVLQFLPDFSLWPGLKLGVDVVFDNGETKYAAVPRSDSNLGEADRIRNQAVQDNFIRVAIPVPPGAESFKIVATSPGVVVDRVGVAYLPEARQEGTAK